MISMLVVVGCGNVEMLGLLLGKNDLMLWNCFFTFANVQSD